MNSGSSWYKKENNKYNIELRVDDLEQIFDKRDPNPFRKRDLDDDASEYITTCASEIGFKKVGKIVIETREHYPEEVIQTIKSAVNDFFKYRVDITQKKLNMTFSLGFRTLFIGLTFLAGSIFISGLLKENYEKGLLYSFLKEGLILTGWVSMWKPVNIFLYEWWPLVTQRNLYDSLSRIEIDVITKARKKLRRLS